ncbi:hypothetical protein SAMN04487764_2981 [Gillisia sp. Hel1_33_143]|uniref:hypothetical protein n=1 Tax=Gillisia sp. Hel1_33_143 TaxID=1336796 RepID=UPI0008796E7D|nr:hypothetical protein [Gillisia sp. Hel1_33_143]SDS75664.1 hypothetical protein SAMN04487764_2981 [Gillisia sp. Hel1_33_143]
MNYTYFYKNKFDHLDKFSEASANKYDLFISAYNESTRVRKVYDNIEASTKHWLVLPEYQFEEIEITHLEQPCFNYSDKIDWDEDEIILDYYENNKKMIGSSNIAIDITGLLRPYIVFLIRFLHSKNFRKVDFIYSEPYEYAKKEDTEFSLDYFKIREIKGCLGSHNPETNNDILFLGSGYDYERMIVVAKEKKEARKIQLLGFPSLQADMFQQNILKSYKAEEDAFSGEFDLDSSNIILSPASDPFVTAQYLSDYIKGKEFTNLYLCPLSTKSQTLGIAIFFINECLEKPASIIFPFCKKYSRETSTGISKVWIYTVEFP